MNFAMVLVLTDSLESDGHDVARGGCAVDRVAIPVNDRVKRLITGCDTHTGINEVVVNRLCADSLQISTQPSDGGNPSAQNSAKKTNEKLELKLRTPVHNMHSRMVIRVRNDTVEIII